jgi:glutathione reductase (NADPH)
MKKFDVIIIGTGTAGQTAAFDLAAEGYNIAIIESTDTPGGVCALRGCQAKKYFYEVAELVARSHHLLGKGVLTPPVADWHQILTEKNAFTKEIPENTVNNLKGNGITYIKGKALFVDESTVAVNNEHLAADYYVVAVGAKPMSLPFEGSEYMITSDDFLELEKLPERIAFIGGGFISFEFAHFAARLGGSKGDIHILETAERVLSPFDGDMVERLVEASEEEGIRIHTNVSIVSIKKSGSGYTVVYTSGENLDVDMVVNGAGRTPNIDALNLEAAGVAYGKRGIGVNHNMQTTRSNIFAVGDCAESLQLARVADMEAHVAAKSVIGLKEGGTLTTIDYSAAPAVLFTYPQLGMVGKTEEQLKEENIKYWKSYDHHLSWPTYRRVGLKHGAFKILVDEHDYILGAHFLSDNTTGLLNTFKQAMIDKTPIAELHKNNIMAPYPSRESDIIYMLSPLIE